MKAINTQKITREWVEQMMDHYKGLTDDDLNQINIRGYFTGMSEQQVYDMILDLFWMNHEHPMKMDGAVKTGPREPALQKQKSFFSVEVFTDQNQCK